MEQLFLEVLISGNNLDDLNKITKLIREGWNLAHWGDSDKNDKSDTKVVLIRKM